MLHRCSTPDFQVRVHNTCNENTLRVGSTKESASRKSSFVKFEEKVLQRESGLLIILRRQYDSSHEDVASRFVGRIPTKVQLQRALRSVDLKRYGKPSRTFKVHLRPGL